MTRDYDRAVGGWTAHLRAGGTTPWAHWSPDASPAAEVPHPLPDSLHLEVLRRLNLAAVAAGRAGPLGRLADRVLATGSPGRGMLDVPLPWPLPFPVAPAFGTAPRDPAALPVAELLRLTTGVLAHLVPGVRPTPPMAPEPDPWPTPWRRRFQLHGSPITAPVVRRSLRAQGLAETSWRATHVVLAQPLEESMAEQWAVRVRGGGTIGLRPLWRRAVVRGSLPASVDVVRIAGRLSAQGHDVHVVVAPDAAQAAAATARLLHAQAPTLGTRSAARTDVVRRVNELTALISGPEQVGDLARRLDELLVGLEPATPLAPPVPPSVLPWAQHVATAQSEALRCAGYPVHGDPTILAPTGSGRRRSPDAADSLELALAACLLATELQEAAP